MLINKIRHSIKHYKTNLLKTPEKGYIFTMYFQQLHVGGFDKNFSYFIGDEVSREVAVIDPIGVPLLQKEITENNLKVTAIIITHGHPDHYGDAAEFYNSLKIKPTLYCHDTVRPKINLPDDSFYLLDPQEKPTPQIKIGSLSLKILFTPGHEPGSICILAENKLFTGDTLFINGCGRADLPGSNPSQLYNSLYKIIGSLPNDTQLYPGHDYGPTPTATLGQQKQENHYLTCKSEEEFINERIRI